MTPRLLANVLLNFYETLNCRATRRRILDSMLSNLLAYGHAGDPGSPLAWAIAAVPSNAVLRSVILTAFAHFLESAVKMMVRRVCVYNGQGLRNDGNYKLAKRIGYKSSDGKFAVRPRSVVSGICGVDGSLLKPVR